MDRLQTFGHVRDIDSERQRITQVISTGIVARDGAIINPKGWDFTNYDRNPVVLWMHNDTAMPFARTVEHEATAKELIATAEFDAEDEVGQEVFRKITKGYINTTSVRWLPKRIERKPPPEGVEVPDRYKDADGNILWFMEQELLEFSYVTIPADPGALILRADGSPFSVTDYAPTTPLPNLASLRGLDCPDGLLVLDEETQRPYPNEHACRLREPGDFQPNSFRRVKREHEGKRYDVIMGRLKGKSSMTEQAYRYPKGVWTASAAKSHCKAHDGKTFEPASGSAHANENGNGHLDLDRLAMIIERFAERRGKQPSAEDMFVTALSRATGKSEERIRREMAEGGFR